MSRKIQRYLSMIKSLGQTAAFAAVDPLTDDINYLFDKDWYSSNIGRFFQNREDAWRHYIDTPSIERSSPSPYFDKSHYLALYPDANSRGVDPFIHFVQRGERQGRSPHPLIDLEWYSRRYGVNSPQPLKHYIDYGWRNGFDPHPTFSSKWYADNSGVSSDPLLHYLLDADQRFDPNPLFSEKSYRASRPNTRTRPLIDFLREGHHSKPFFCAAFDYDYYQDQARTIGYKSSFSDPLSSFLESPIEVNPHPLFDRKFVREQLPANEYRNELIEFLSDGTKRLDPHPLFSTKYYLKNNPDVRSSDLVPLIHYLSSGYKENRSPHPLLDMRTYREHGQDLPSELNPLLHYMSHGSNENRPIFPSVPPVLSARRQTRDNLNVDIRSGTDNDGPNTIGVFIHAYYPDLMTDILNQVNLIEGDVRCFISTTDSRKAYEVSKICDSISRYPYEIRTFPNRGRDIAPMIVGFSDRLKEVDLALHLHTKKSPHYNSGFDDWRKYLLESNIGYAERARQIIELFNDPTVGAIAPVDFPAVSPLIQWGGNMARCARLVEMMTGDATTVSADSLLELPSGSMFWFRPSGIAPLLDLKLDALHFDCEAGQVDGTLAHAIERAFFYVVEIAGLRWLRFNPKQGEISAFEPGRLLPLESRVTPITSGIPEAILFSGARSDNPRPRINLLIPTAERSIGYAGVSEALRLFFGAYEHLQSDFDCRLISTDVPFSNQIHPEMGGVILGMDDNDVGNGVVYIDGTAKRSRCLDLRSNDIFVGAAWWNAVQARHLSQIQEKMFSRKRLKFVYLIQDYEPGFYPWSTKSAIVESTYHNSGDIIPVFNTPILFDFFRNNGYFSEGIVYNPPINENIKRAVDLSKPREPIMLLYMRPSALRNCLEFADSVIGSIERISPLLANEWRFLAIGEDIADKNSIKTNRIEQIGRLSLREYADLLSTARVGLSLMVSPHPSYPPLEMADSGIKVLTNTYLNKDLSFIHRNISSFSVFDEDEVARKLIELMSSSLPIDTGDDCSKIDWFFNGRSNLHSTTKALSDGIRLEICPADG